MYFIKTFRFRSLLSLTVTKKNLYDPHYKVGKKISCMYSKIK